MKRLRRLSFDSGIENEVRGSGRRWTRVIYLTCLGLFALALLRLVVGDYVVLRGDGIVLRDRIDVGVEYNATIQAVFVDEGQQVERGDPIFALRSLDARRTLATLRRDEAELEADLYTARAEYTSLPRLIQLAESRYSVAEARLRQVRDLESRSLVSSAELGQAIDAEFKAKLELEELNAALVKSGALVDGLSDTLQRLRGVIHGFENDYDGGTVKSPVTGQVAPDLPYPGAVIEPGDTAISILSGAPYVLGYIPTGTLYSIDQGDAVIVFAGADAYRGRIERVSNYARSVPQELLDTLGRPERRRVVRVVFDGEAPPVFSTVTVRHAALAWLPL